MKSLIVAALALTLVGTSFPTQRTTLAQSGCENGQCYRNLYQNRTRTVRRSVQSSVAPAVVPASSDSPVVKEVVRTRSRTSQRVSSGCRGCNRGVVGYFQSRKPVRRGVARTGVVVYRTGRAVGRGSARVVRGVVRGAARVVSAPVRWVRRGRCNGCR